MSERTVLLAEDNHGDVRLIEEAFDDRALPGTIHAVHTGDEALDWLFRRGDAASAPRPDVALVDLNLPGTSGHDVLAQIRADPDLQRLPVIVLTGSSSDQELVAAYEEGANACVVKPVDPEAFADSIEAFARFWLSSARLPTEPDAPDEAGQ